MVTMRSKNEHRNTAESTSYRELRLLSEVHHNSAASQRDLSKRVGIALGLTNVLLRNLASKGYVRVTKAGWKRWLYALTPAGLSRKVQLTVAYFHRFLSHYQTVRQTLRDELEPLDLNAESRVAIYGTGEFAELVYLGLREIGIEEIDVFGPLNSGHTKFLGMPVGEASMIQHGDYDRVMVALLTYSDEGYTELTEQGVSPAKVVRFFEGQDTQDTKEEA